MDIQFRGKIWQWRGPAPYYFVTVPEKHSRNLQVIAGLVTYGWGMLPVTVTVGRTEWKTALFPKDGRYVVPLKDRVRAAEQLADGATITVRLAIRQR